MNNSIFIEHLKPKKIPDCRLWIRLTIIFLLIIASGISHWITPTSYGYFHVFHLVLRKLFIVPIVLAAIWFNIRGAVLATVLISLIYIPHGLVQWSGQTAENMNQIGEVITLWVIATISGIFIRKEKDALREVARTHEGSLTALVAALDAREHETELHSLRVRSYALRLAEELLLTEKDKTVLGQASLLHDIGKIGTPDDILLKRGSLDKKEWKIMRQHPGIGYTVVSSVPFLEEAADMVYSHHERFDGNGYPRGLKGNSIPLSARIFAVVDVFDALTKDRPYRKKLTCSEAREVIRGGSGTHFDPEVVDAFLKIEYSEWERIDKDLSDKLGRAFCPD